MPNEIPAVFHNGSNYDFLFIIKELASKFEGKFECPEGNTKKYKTFSVTIEKEVTKIDKDRNESAVTIPYKIKFIDTARFGRWKLHYQILSITLNSKFTKLNVKVVIVFLNMRVLKKIQ